jgi:OOP family OmpA-OmpF porin
MLFNLSNLFFPHRNNTVNVVAVAGAPFNLAIPHTWVQNYGQATTEGTHKWNTAWKIGGQVEFDLSKNWGVNVEAGTNYVRQRSSTIYDNNKWWPYAMAGLTYKFGFKKSKKADPVQEVVEVVEEQPKPEPKTEIVQEVKPEPKPVVVKQPAKTSQNIFFKIGSATISQEQVSKVDDLAAWAKKYPNATFELTGYADKATGNARYNMALSEKRAAAVKDALVKNGVEADRINVSWKGDTVQPFNLNDDNRVVIILGEE